MGISAINWPAGLPQTPTTPVGSPVETKLPEDTAVFDKPEAGPAVGRQRSTAVYRPIYVPLIVRTLDELDIFDEFYLETLAGGTLPFNWPGWVRKGSEVLMFDVEADPPNPQPLGGGVHMIPLNLVQYPDGGNKRYIQWPYAKIYIDHVGRAGRCHGRGPQPVRYADRCRAGSAV